MNNFLGERLLKNDDVKQLREIFDSSLDLELIHTVIYFDGWCGYEENGGIFIFRAIDGSIQKANFGYCVTSENNDNAFTLKELTPEQAAQEIKNMEDVIAKGLTEE